MFSNVHPSYKQVAYENFNEPDLQNRGYSLFGSKELFGEDFIEGPVAFAEKRLPDGKVSNV